MCILLITNLKHFIMQMVHSMMRLVVILLILSYNSFRECLDPFGVKLKMQIQQQKAHVNFTQLEFFIANELLF